MKRRMRESRRFVPAGMLAAVGLLLSGGVWAARAENDPDARFRGGSYDGYERRELNQSGTDWATFAALLAARSRGGSYDGFALGATTGATLPRRGTLMMLR